MNKRMAVFSDLPESILDYIYVTKCNHVDRCNLDIVLSKKYRRDYHQKLGMLCKHSKKRKINAKSNAIINFLKNIPNKDDQELKIFSRDNDIELSNIPKTLEQQIIEKTINANLLEKEENCDNIDSKEKLFNFEEYYIDIMDKDVFDLFYDHYSKKGKTINPSFWKTCVQNGFFWKKRDLLNHFCDKYNINEQEYMDVNKLMEFELNPMYDFFCQNLDFFHEKCILEKNEALKLLDKCVENMNIEGYKLLSIRYSEVI